MLSWSVCRFSGLKSSTVHQNFVGIDGSKSPFILSVCLTDADNYGVPQYRAIVWRKTVTRHLLLTSRVFQYWTTVRVICFKVVLSLSVKKKFEFALTCFPVLGGSNMYLLPIVIDSVCCYCLLCMIDKSDLSQFCFMTLNKLLLSRDYIEISGTRVKHHIR